MESEMNGDVYVKTHVLSTSPNKRMGEDEKKFYKNES
jgi:hypothetical protein